MDGTPLSNVETCGPFRVNSGYPQGASSCQVRDLYLGYPCKARTTVARSSAKQKKKKRQSNDSIRRLLLPAESNDSRGNNERQKI